MVKKLSEPQESLVRKLSAGAKLQHDQATGLFRLQDGPVLRTIHPATAQSLLTAGVIRKSLMGVCSLS